MVGCHFGLAALIEGGSRASAPYLPETIAHEIGRDSVRTLGCLDVGLVPFSRGATSLLDLHVGNRCGYPEAFDLRRLAIEGQGEAGTSFDVNLVDPRGEIDVVHIGGADRGHERIRLDAPSDAKRLCFRFDGVNPDAPEAKVSPVCFDRTAEAWRVA